MPHKAPWPPIEKMYTVKELTELLGYAPSTTRAWIRKRPGRYIKLFGEVRIPEHVFLAILAGDDI
jgi:helix-turn-helix protein